MSDKVLIDISEEFNFKIYKDIFFGLYKDQVIGLTYGYNGQYDLAINLKEGVDEELSAKDNRKKLNKMVPCFNIHITSKSIVFNGIHCGLREKARKDKLLEKLHSVCEFLKSFQKFEGVESKDIILVMNIPMIRSEDAVIKIKTELRKEKEKELNYQKGFILSTLCVVFGSITLGSIFGILNIKYELGIHPISTSIFFIPITEKIYNTFAGGVDKISRWIIGFISTLGFLCWELFRYSTIMHLQGEKISYSYLIDFVKVNMNFDTEIGRSTAIGITILWLFTFLLVRRTDNSKFSIEEGKLIDKKKVDELNLMNKGNVYTGYFIGVGFLLLLGSILLLTTDNRNLFHFSYNYFFISAAIFHITLLPIYKFIRNQSPAFDIGMKIYKITRMPYWFDFLFSNLFLALYSASFAMVLLWGNIKFSETNNLLLKGQLLETYSRKNKCQILDVKTESYDILELKVCKAQYSFLEEGLKTNVIYRKGYFGFPYSVSVFFPELDSFAEYMKKEGSSELLRAFQIKHFYKNDKSDEFKNTIDSWKAKCLSDQGHFCRLASYIYGEDKKYEEQISFLNKGCNLKDLVSCYGLILHEKVDQTEKLKRLEFLEALCIGNDKLGCFNLGYSYFAFDKKKYREKGHEALDKSCELGYKQACITD